MRVWRAAAWRIRNTYWAIGALPTRIAAWIGFQRHKHHYQFLDEAGLRALRKSDTVFVFGSGGSLNEIAPAEWRAIEAHDTLGFNWFVNQRFVRCDFQVVREFGYEADWRKDIRRYFDVVASNPCYDSTTFLVQSGFAATMGNRAIWLEMLPKKRPLFLFRSWRRKHPSTSLAEGVTHTEGTLSDCINLAALLGWRHIVLCGVDLYNRQYFWLPSGEPRYGDTTTSGRHNTAIGGGIVETVRDWREFYDSRGVSLYTYNPRSLLADVLPVWQSTARTITP